MNGMRVLITVPSLAREFGGPAFKARALARALEARHPVTLLGCAAAPVDGAVALKPVARFHGTPVPLDFGRIVSAVRAADVVQIVGYRDPVGTVAALAARRLRVPYLLEPSGMLKRRLRSVPLKRGFDATIGRSVVSGAGLLIATSALEAAELREDGIAGSRVVVRPNGITLEELSPLPPRGVLRRSLGIPDDVPLVLALGRIARKKGLTTLVESLARVPRAHLVVAGPDDGDGALADVMGALDRLALHPRVHVMPDGLWGAAKAQALADSDLFCLFSMTENFGTAALEAAACGVCTVLSDRCGAAEFLADGAVVVPLADPDRLSDVLVRLCGDPAERAMVAAAGLRAAATLTWDAIADRQSKIYESLAR